MHQLTGFRIPSPFKGFDGLEGHKTGTGRWHIKLGKVNIHEASTFAECISFIRGTYGMSGKLNIQKYYTRVS